MCQMCALPPPPPLACAPPPPLVCTPAGFHPPPAPSVRFAFGPPNGWTCYPNGQMIPPPPVVAKKKETPKPPKKKKKCEQSKPPVLQASEKYVWPPTHTYVHLITGTKVWESTKKGWGFKKKRVPTCLSVREFLDAIAGSDAKGLIATEVFELGDGKFSKGFSIEYGSDKAKAPLASYGWTEKRGGDGGLPPVWLVLHKKKT